MGDLCFRQLYGKDRTVLVRGRQLQRASMGFDDFTTNVQPEAYTAMGWRPVSRGDGSAGQRLKQIPSALLRNGFAFVVNFNTDRPFRGRANAHPNRCMGRAMLDRIANEI